MSEDKSLRLSCIVKLTTFRAMKRDGVAKLVMKKNTFRLFALLMYVATALSSKAQIGYQVSLLNTATGEPRANVTVNASVTITNSKGESIYSGTQSATSNDFGVLSLIVGNADTFKNVDFGKLPFFIQVSVDGKMIGRSQILNVPVASNIPEEALSKTYTFTWKLRVASDGCKEGSYTKVTLSSSGSFTIEYYKVDCEEYLLGTYDGVYEVIGNTIWLPSHPHVFLMYYRNGQMFMNRPDL